MCQHTDPGMTLKHRDLIHSGRVATEPSGSKAIEMISCLFPLKCGVYESIPMNQLALKEKNPIKIISYRVPMIFLDTKGCLKLLRVI